MASAGNHYSVDASLIGRRIELRVDPEDLTRLRCAGTADRSARRSPSSSAATSTARSHKFWRQQRCRLLASLTWVWSRAQDDQLLRQIAYRDLPRTRQKRRSSRARRRSASSASRVRRSAKTIPRRSYTIALASRPSRLLLHSESLLGVVTGEVDRQTLSTSLPQPSACADHT